MTRLFATAVNAEVDSIIALNELFRADPTPHKINVVQGHYQDEFGVTPVLRSVRSAAQELVETERIKPPLPARGDDAFLRASEALVFGQDADVLKSGRVHSLQTPGSTAALRIAAEMVQRYNPAATAWVSTPAYSNHIPLMTSAGLSCAQYRYADPISGHLTFNDMLDDLDAAKPGDIVILHACSHNPAAVDLNLDQWSILGDFLTRRSLVPLIDNAYLGLLRSIDDDPKGLRTLVSICPESMVTTSYSKNFALYGERVGLLSIIGSNADQSSAAADVAKAFIRTVYTSPAIFGARVVARVLNDPARRSEWLIELAEMRDALHRRRAQLADALDAHQVDSGLFPYLREGRGMFTLSRLTPEQVGQLRHEHQIYLLDTGRVSLAGMRKPVLERFCEGVAAITRGARVDASG